jgi:hypothetical protein
MSAVEDIRQVFQDFLAPELRDIRGQMAALAIRIDAMDKRLEIMEAMNGVRFQAMIQHLEQIQ